MAHDVFISFKSEDGEFAEKICDDLDSRGIKCWISSRGIRGGQNYQGAIGSALLEASVMVLVFSAAADKSDEIIKELSMASKYKKHMIPVRIENFLPEKGTNFDYAMASCQYIDLFKNWEKEIDHLAADIKFMMASTVGEGQLVEQQINLTSLPVGEVPKDNKYLDILNMAYADGEVSSSERDFLDRRANELGISSDHAKELEEQVRKIVGGSTNTSSASIIQGEPVANRDLTWPNVGVTFLKSVREILDPSQFPFTPTDIAQDDSIEENNFIWWQINEKYFISVALRKKRLDKITVVWGIYSESEKRDPIFRQACDEFNQIPEAIDSEGVFHVNDLSYELSSEGIGNLGFETIQKVSFAELSEPGYFKHVSIQLTSFISVIWGVASKNLIK